MNPGRRHRRRRAVGDLPEYGVTSATVSHLPGPSTKRQAGAVWIGSRRFPSLAAARDHQRLSLGDEDPTTLAWQEQMLTTAQNHLAFVQQQELRERQQKWISIAVTASIPVFGMIWKALLGRRRARMSL